MTINLSSRLLLFATLLSSIVTSNAKNIETKKNVVHEIKTLQEFEQKIKSGKLFITKWYADWCPSCKQITPIFEKVASEDSEHKYFSIDAGSDEFYALGNQMEISSIPTITLIRGNKLITKIVGFKTEEEIRKIIENTANGTIEKEVAKKNSKKTFFTKIKDWFNNLF